MIPFGTDGDFKLDTAECTFAAEFVGSCLTASVEAATLYKSGRAFAA